MVRKVSTKFSPIVFVCFLITASSTLSFSQGWTVQNSDPSYNLYAVQFLSLSKGWAAGGVSFSSHIILHTSDGGSTWVAQRGGMGGRLADIFFVDTLTGWAVGESGHILHTTDGGTTWENQNAATPYNLFGVYFLDAENGWVAGDWQTLLHTTDGGDNWVEQTVPLATRSLGDFHFNDPLHGWVTGVGGDIFYTGNGGTTWTRQITGVSVSLPGIDFVDDTTGWVTGGGGVVLHTTDAGAEWSQQKSGTDAYLPAVVFINSKIGWMAGTTGTASIILHSTDGGVSWTEQEYGMAAWYDDISFVDSLHGWAVGEQGTIVHTDSGGISTAIGQTEPYATSSFSLMQNYPNPFNPGTTISFSVPGPGDVTLRIFNLIGVEVATLFSGLKDAGTHKIEWDATGHPSGVYLYRLQTGDFTETRKLVLLK